LSLILDALNRSRQESSGTPGLSDNHFPAQEPGSGSRLVWLLVTALALAVLAVGWLLFDRLPEPAAPPVSAAQQTPARTVPLPTAKAERPVAVAVPRQPPQQAAEQAAEQATPAAQTTAPTAPPTAPVAQSSAPAAPTAVEPAARERAPVDDNIAALYRQQAQEPETAKAVEREKPAAPAKAADTGRAETVSREEQQIDIEALVQQAQAELADARLADNGVPFLANLSQQTKDGIPTIMYQRHDYSGDPARSSVVINGKTLRAGGSASGVKVVEILPDSAVFEYQGTRFRLRALNSWVNL
jgi:general secretion pathway protein B